MKYIVLVIILAVFIGYLVYEKQSSLEYKLDYSTTENLSFPKINGPLIDGNYPSETIYQKYAVHFWATWCPTCKVDMPQLMDIIRKNPKVYFYMLSERSELKDVKKVIKKYKELPPNVAFIEDINQLVKNELRTLKLPEFHLFDSNKKYIRKFIGVNIVKDEMVKLLKSDI